MSRAYLEKGVNNVGNIVLPPDVLEPDWVDVRRKESRRVHHAGHVRDAAGSDFIREKFCGICPERCPAEIVGAIGEKDGDEDADGVVVGLIRGIH